MGNPAQEAPLELDPVKLKLDLARAQLGTATELFTRDRDPISVHVLSCGACELLEGVGKAGGKPVLSTFILEHQPAIDMAKIVRLRNQHWNAMKHFYKRDNETIRDDTELISSFSDRENDTTLFEGWHDYQAITGKLPVDAQVMQVWYFAINEEKLAPGVDREPFRVLFPDIRAAAREEQKRRLRRVCEKYRNDRRMLGDPRTEASVSVNRRGDRR